MEEQQVILKIFRALAEEEEVEEFITTQGDSEITCDMKKNDDRGFEETLSKRSSLSWLLLPPAGEKFICDSEDAENGPQVTNEERRPAGNSCESFGTERELNRQNERNAAGDCEPEQVACQLISDCRYPDCVCAAAHKQDDDDDDAGEAEHSLREECEQSDVKEASKSSSSSAERLNTLTHTGPEAGEQHGSTGKPTLEQSDEHFYFKDANEEKSGAEEEGKNKEIKAFPYHLSSPKHASLNISPSDTARNPPSGSTISRATYSPGSPTEKHSQLPALFSGLRVLRKGVLGPEQDSVAPLRPSPQGSGGEILPGKAGEAKGSILEQISNFLSRERRSEEEEKEDGERRQVQSEEDADAPPEPLKPVSSAEAAFDAFKAFFTPKPLKRDPGEKVDLEAVRKRIKAERDALRALFEGTSAKSSEQKEPSDHQVGTTCYGRQHTFNLTSICSLEESYNILFLQLQMIELGFFLFLSSLKLKSKL